MSSQEESMNPFAILGLPEYCDEESLRERYLALVKKFPPDQDPERFREIQTAYERAKDPLVFAEHLVAQYVRDPDKWTEVIEAEKSRRPRLTTTMLLSLGNAVPEDQQDSK